MKRRGFLRAAGAARAGFCWSRERPTPAPRTRESTAVCAPDRRDRLRSGADQRPVLAQRHRAHLRTPLHVRPSGAPVQAEALHRGGNARGVGRLRVVDRQAQAGHLLRRRPGVQGPAARAGRAGLRLFVQAHLRPALEGSVRCKLVAAAYRRARRAARAGAQDKEAVRLRPQIEGLRALDRYTLQFKLAEPEPRFLYSLADTRCPARWRARWSRPTATRSMEHPVGTGPFRLAEWRRSSRIVLERNPTYREVLYDAEPNPDDASGQALAAAFQRTAPADDRPCRDVGHRGEPAALAVVPQQSAGPARAHRRSISPTWRHRAASWRRI